MIPCWPGSVCDASPYLGAGGVEQKEQGRLSSAVISGSCWLCALELVSLAEVSWGHVLEKLRGHPVSILGPGDSGTISAVPHIPLPVSKWSCCLGGLHGFTGDRCLPKTVEGAGILPRLLLTSGP